MGGKTGSVGVGRITKRVTDALDAGTITRGQSVTLRNAIEAGEWESSAQLGAAVGTFINTIDNGGTTADAMAAAGRAGAAAGTLRPATPRRGVRTRGRRG